MEGAVDLLVNDAHITSSSMSTSEMPDSVARSEYELTIDDTLSDDMDD